MADFGIVISPWTFQDDSYHIRLTIAVSPAGNHTWGRSQRAVISTTGELTGNLYSQGPPQPYWIKSSGRGSWQSIFYEAFLWLCHILRFETSSFKHVSFFLSFLPSFLLPSLPSSLPPFLPPPFLSSFFFSVLGFELRAYTLTQSTSPFFVMCFFKIVLGTICTGWLWITILLISAS
jgi:hypothetical protein